VLIPNGGTSNGRGYLGKQKDGNFIEKAKKSHFREKGVSFDKTSKCV